MKHNKAERMRHKAMMFAQQRVRRNHPAQIPRVKPGVSAPYVRRIIDWQTLILAGTLKRESLEMPVDNGASPLAAACAKAQS
jgi:hypothetical protein